MGGLFTKCPHCSQDLDPDIATCPHCSGEVEVAGGGSTRRTAWIVLAILCACGGIFFLVRASLRPKGVEVTGPDGQKYIRAPVRDLKGPEDSKPLIRVAALAVAPPERIKVVLSEELGPAARIWHERIAGQWHWVAVIFSPALRNTNARIEVLPYKNRVLFIKFQFQSPYPNRAELLTLLGLSPCLTPPTVDAMAGPRWTCFQGLDEIGGVYEPEGGPGIREVTVTPNKALANYFFRGGQ
jgi:hypothetical protein